MLGRIVSFTFSSTAATSMWPRCRASWEALKPNWMKKTRVRAAKKTKQATGVARTTFQKQNTIR